MRKMRRILYFDFITKKIFHFIPCACLSYLFNANIDCHGTILSGEWEGGRYFYT